MCTRGGYGSERIVDGLHLGALAERPKIFVGSSDITAVHLKLREIGLVSFYGPSLAWEPDRNGVEAATWLRRMLMEEVAGATLAANATEPTFRLRHGAGIARGRLAGGNLALLASACGTPTQPAFNGALLFIEEVNEPPYRIDRFLNQLIRAGVLTGVSAVIVGQFTNCVGSPEEPDVLDVVSETLQRLQVPYVGGFAIGHGPDQATVPIGLEAELDVDNRQLRFIDSATSVD